MEALNIKIQENMLHPKTKRKFSRRKTPKNGWVIVDTSKGKAPVLNIKELLKNEKWVDVY
jgi:hypothetical protein